MKQRKNKCPQDTSTVYRVAQQYDHIERWRLDLLEDIQSHNHGNPKELSDLNLLLKVTAAVCHQLDVLQENQTPCIASRQYCPTYTGRPTRAGFASIYADFVCL